MLSIARTLELPSARMRPDPASIKAKVLALLPPIKAAALATEQAATVPAASIEMLREAGYFEIVKPQAFGGYEHDFDLLVDLNIELAKACASTAWVAGLLAGHQWLLASFPGQAQHDVWDRDPHAVLCGSYAPAAKAAAGAAIHALASMI